MILKTKRKHARSEIRRDRTAEGSLERKVQVNLAKVEAARYLTLGDLRKRDEPTYTYLRRNKCEQALSEYYSTKLEAIYNSCPDEDTFNTPEDYYDALIYKDIVANAEKDKLETKSDYRIYRPEFYKFLSETGSLEQLGKDLDYYSKPVSEENTFVPKPIVRKQ